MSQFNPNFHQPSPNHPFEIAQINPSDLAKTYYQEALANHQKGEIELAIQLYQKAIDLDPKFDSPYINLSLIFIGIGQLDDAKTLLEKVLTLPDRDESPASIHALANYNLGIIYNRLEDPAAALEKMKETLAIAPDFPQAQKFLKQLEHL